MRQVPALTETLLSVEPLSIDKKNIIPLWVIMFFNTFSYTLIFPALTFAVYDPRSSLFALNTPLSHRAWIYGLCMAFMHVGGIIAAPLLGILTDVIGRKKVLCISTIGTLSFPVLTIIGLCCSNIYYVLVGSLIMGLLSRADPIAQAIIGDTANSKNKFKLMGYLQFFISFGAFIGPLAGGYLTHLSFHHLLADFYLPFIVAAVASSFAIINTLSFLPETFQVKKLSWNKADFQKILLPLFNHKVIKISFILFLSQITWSFYYQFIPPALKLDFHFSAWLLGIFIAMIAFWLASASFLGIKLLQRFNKSNLINILTLVLLIGSLLNLEGLVVHHQILVWISAIPIAGADVLLYCIITALYSDAVPSCSQGSVMALCFIIISIAWSLTGLFGGMLGAISHNLPLIIAPVGVLLLLFVKK